MAWLVWVLLGMLFLRRLGLGSPDLAWLDILLAHLVAVNAVASVVYVCVVCDQVVSGSSSTSGG